MALIRTKVWLKLLVKPLSVTVWVSFIYWACFIIFVHWNCQAEWCDNILHIKLWDLENAQIMSDEPFISRDTYPWLVKMWTRSDIGFIHRWDKLMKAPAYIWQTRTSCQLVKLSGRVIHYMLVAIGLRNSCLQEHERAPTYLPVNSCQLTSYNLSEIRWSSQKLV